MKGTKKNLFKNSLSLAIRAMIGMTAMSLLASAHAETSTLEEIVVTAQKRSESLQDVPVTVTAFSETIIREAGIADAGDVAALTPSLTITSFANPFNARISVRGIGTAQQDPFLEPSVGMFVDGVYFNRSGLGMSDLVDIERIEVLQGPQGTLYGKNTNAGAISVTTKRPNLEAFEGSAVASVGNYGMTKLTLAASGPISDTVAFRLVGNINERDGYLNNSGGEDLDNADDSNLQGKLLWQPSDDLSVLFSASHVERDTACCGADSVQSDIVNALLVGQGFSPDSNDEFDRDIATNDATLFDMEADAASLTIEYDTDFGELKSITAWNDYEYTVGQDIDRSQLDILAAHDDVFSGDSFSQELLLSASTGDQLDYQVGLFYSKTTTERGGKNGAPILTLGSDFVPVVSAVQGSPAIAFSARSGDNITADVEQEAETLALFSQATWHIGSDWHLTGGLRYTEEEKEADLLAAANSTAPGFIPAGAFGMHPVLGPLPATNVPVGRIIASFTTPIDSKLNRKSDNVDWLLRAAYDLNDDTMLFASAATGTKSGGYNSLSGLATEREFDDEETLNYELGIKSTLLDSRLRINATAFLTEITGFQQAVLLDSGIGFAVQNAAEVEVSGLDVQVDALPLPFLTLSAGLQYLNSYEYTKGPSAGLNLPYTAELSGNLAATFVFPLADGGVYWRTDYSYMDEHGNAGDPAFAALDSVQQTRTLVNSTIGWRNEKWDIYLWGKNLTDDDYAQGIGPQPLTDMTVYFLTPPRTYGVTVRYNFGG
jgi:iron complex outermembrane recepter protein